MYLRNISYITSYFFFLIVSIIAVNAEISASPDSTRKREIHGRFLLITDIHPDVHYKEGADEDRACHSGKGNSGKYGLPLSSCDSPISLINSTFDWILENLKDKIDFIVWTGDNMRHDNDRNLPRSEQQIFEMNEVVANLFVETFGLPSDINKNKLSIPIIQSLGNNDVYPHNLFSPGPTLQTRELNRIWRYFIPNEQYHIFDKGAYYFVEVIPNKLAVVSLNTMYLYRSNPLVDFCNDREEPGYQMFAWLGVVLKEFRERGMKCYLSGHVPPVLKNYDPGCLSRYTLWVHEFRDVVIGGLYGHMNMDHFVPNDAVIAYNHVQDTEDSFMVNVDDVSGAETYEEELRVMGIDPDDQIVRIKGNKVGYMNEVREAVYSKLKSEKNSFPFGSRYGITNIHGSVIPNYYPALRVYEYNITDLNADNEEEILEKKQFKPWNEVFDEFYKMQEYENNKEFEESQEYDSWGYRTSKTPKKDKSIPPNLIDPRTSIGSVELGPAYIPQLFTPLKYFQYFANLTAINNGEFDFRYDLEYESDKAYGLKDLTVSQYLKLGRKLGKPIKQQLQEIESYEIEGKKKKDKNTKKDKKLLQLWDDYVRRVFIDSGYEIDNDPET